MRLREVTVKNFRNFAKFTVPLEDFSVIIGPNNVGKTNFLQAMECVFSPTSARYVHITKQDFRDPAKPIVVEVVFDGLTETDKAAFFHDEGLINPVANTITIRFESAWSSVEQDVWNECHFIRDDLPEQEQRVTDFFPKFKQMVPLFAIPSSRSAIQEISLSRSRDFGRIVRLFADDYLKPIETLRQEVTRSLEQLEEEEEYWEDFPEREFQVMQRKISSLLSVVQDNFAERILQSGSEVILDNLAELREEWEAKCHALQEACENRTRSLLSKQVMFLLEKANTLLDRCTAQLALYELRDSMLGKQQFERLSNEFNTVFGEILPSQQFALSLFPIQDDELISQASVDIDGFPVLGHGSGYQSIFVVGLKLMRTLSQLILTEGLDVRNFILAIEEPEVHLHPHMQRHLMNSLRRLQRLWNEKGYRLQIIVTTHSPSIVGRAGPHELIRFHRESNQTKAIKWRESELQMIAEELEPDESRRGRKYNQLRNWLEFFQERYADVFFSNCVIVVEGETEEGAIPVWAGKLNPPVDCDQLAISLVNGRGDSMTYALKVLDRLGIDHTCLYDQGDGHYVVGVSHGGIYATDGDEFEDDVIASVQLGSIIKALELVSSETSNEHRLGWIKRHIGGCEGLGDWEDLSEVLERGDLGQTQMDQLRTEALRWIKKSAVKSLTFGRALASVTTTDELPKVCQDVIKDAAERARRKMGVVNG